MRTFSYCVHGTEAHQSLDGASPGLRQPLLQACRRISDRFLTHKPYISGTIEDKDISLSLRSGGEHRKLLLAAESLALSAFSF
jgi:hypothetical protein